MDENKQYAHVQVPYWLCKVQYQILGEGLYSIVYMPADKSYEILFNWLWVRIGWLDMIHLTFFIPLYILYFHCCQRDFIMKLYNSHFIIFFSEGTRSVIMGSREFRDPMTWRRPCGSCPCGEPTSWTSRTSGTTRRRDTGKETGTPPRERDAQGPYAIYKSNFYYFHVAVLLILISCKRFIHCTR